MEFVWPLITEKKVTGYENKLIEQEKIEVEFHKRTPSEYISRQLGEEVLILFGFAATMIFLGFLAGIREAMTQEEYYISEQRPGYVIATLNDSMVIFVKYDSSTNTILKEYIIQPLDICLKLQKQRIGRLIRPPQTPDNKTNTSDQKRIEAPSLTHRIRAPNS